MPNHVTIVCAVIGPEEDVARFEAAHLRTAPEEKHRAALLDFGTIIPKPAILDETENGSEASLGIAALVGDVVYLSELAFRGLPPEALTGQPVHHAESARAWLAKNRPKVLEKGRACLWAIVETGYPDWYTWACANWGTKWGAYDFERRSREPGRFAFKFETAWSFPDPIFRRLAEMYPTLVFDVIAHDEGDQFGCDGQFNGRNDYRCEKSLGNAAQYARVHGHAREEDGEDANA